MVDIYLHDEPQSPFLSIPNSDVERLSNRPFRWLRYVMFTICGAHGDLFKMPDATDGPVDYDTTSMADLPAVIYYKPSEDCIFVDYQALNDQITSTEQTNRGAGFKREVALRDGSCVITGEDAGECDAAHLIPRCKGDEYIAKVVGDRSPLYDSPPSISGIDDVQNGMSLINHLHRRLDNGRAAFLKTPNYGLEPTDIKRVDLGPARTDYITLQQLEKPQYDNPGALVELIEMARLRPSFNLTATLLFHGAHLDVQFRGPLPLQPSQSSPPLPPHVLILDFMYGVAAYKRWRSSQDSDKVHAIMKEYRRANYDHIPTFPRQANDDDDPPNLSDDPPSDDPGDRDYKPHKPRRREHPMVTAIDELTSVLMLIRGITPQEAVVRREKRMEEEELKAQEASRSKVMQWIKTTTSTAPPVTRHPSSTASPILLPVCLRDLEQDYDVAEVWL